MDAPLHPDLLLQHGRFVRRLALRLVRDSHAADDVAQDAWLRTLERPSLEVAGLRPWLRRVVSNLALNRRRAEANQRARQQASARAEALPSVAEEFEQAELLREVIDAVLALAEPYRTTILCRYFRGWDAPRLARETDTPLATVRSREQRALAQLREALDRKEGGRAAWALALGRLVDLPGSPLPSTGPAPAVKLGLLAAAGIGAVFAVRFALPRSAAVDPVPAQPASAGLAALEPAASSPSASAALTPAHAPAAARVATASSGLAPGASGSSGASTAVQADTAEIRGRFLLPGGAPAAGVDVKLHGRIGTEERLQFGEPEDWQDPSTVTGADGRFAFVFAPPRAFHYDLDAKRAGFARERRHLDDELVAGDVEDLGEIELLLGGALEGRLLDASGAPFHEENLEVRADGQTANLNNAPVERRPTWELVPVDPETGDFAFEDLAPGRVRLSVTKRRNAWFDGPTAVIVGGERVIQDVVYDGPDLSRRITLSTSTRPFHPVAPEHASIRLTGEGIEPRAPRTDPPRISLVFDDLAPGEYTLTIDDPRFLPWSQSGITPGSRVSAKLVGSASLVLDVRDAAGNVLPFYAVEATLRDVNFKPDRFRLHAGDAPLAAGRVEGLVPGDYTIAVSVEGLGTRSLALEDVLANETRTLSFVFGPATVLAGRVERPDGAPVGDVDVLLLSPARVGDSPACDVVSYNGFSSDTEHTRHELARTRTDQDGAFRFEPGAPGTYALYTFQGELEAATESLSVGDGEQRENVVIELPAGGRVRGHVALPAGTCAGLRVSPRREFELGIAPGRDASDMGRVALASDGTFELGPFPAGPLELLLCLPEAFLTGYETLGDRTSGSWPLGSVQLVEGATVEAEFELGAGQPAEVAVDVLVDGAPAAGVKVALLEAVGEFELEQARVLSDVDGRARLPVFPGTVQLLLEDADRGWSFVDAAPLQLGPGQTRSVARSIELVTGTLSVVDATSGTALAHAALLLSVDGGTFWHSSLCRPTTDASGQLTLRLPAGTYRFARSDGGPSMATVVWTASGPTTSQLEL